MISLNEQFKLSINYFNELDKAQVIKAFDLTIKKHEGQKRASGEDYSIHPVSVAKILADMNVDKDMVIAGLLHDVVEDTDTTTEDIEAAFSPEIARLVNGVTKISKLKSANKSEQKAETIRKMLLAMINDIRVIIVKLADKLHNMRTLQFLPEQKIRRIANETLEIYSPLAGKMGMNVIKNELENLALKNLYPDIYESIDSFIINNELNNEKTILIVKEKISGKIEKLNIPFSIKARAKHYYSIFKKMKKYDKKIDEIFDLYGMRIVTDSIENCYQIFGVVHSLWQPIPGRFKDYIANPKKNGYKSLHTTVLIEKRKAVEIQIRTKDMDEFNEYGIASHWYYKKNEIPTQNNLTWLKSLMDLNQQSLSTNEYYQTIRDEILKDEIYVFTPKGDLYEMPKNATPLDFAYRIHTEVGHRCRGAKANGSIIPLHAPLRNGMVVEIITGKESKPKQSWLSIVKTNNAKKKIRHYFIELAKSEALVKPEVKTEVKPVKRKVTENKKNNNISIEIAGEKNLLFSFARCCTPSPNDKIVGYISWGRGVMIHKADCKNLSAITNFEDRTINVNWVFPSQKNYYNFFIRVTGDTAYNDITNVVKKHDSTIVEFTLDESTKNQNKTDGVLSLEMPQKTNIEIVLKELRRIPSVVFIDKK